MVAAASYSRVKPLVYDGKRTSSPVSAKGLSQNKVNISPACRSPGIQKTTKKTAVVIEPNSDESLYKPKKRSSKSVLQRKKELQQLKTLVPIDCHLSVEVKKKSSSAGSLNYKKIHQLLYVDFKKPKSLAKEDWPECESDIAYTKEELAAKRNSYEYYKAHPSEFTCQPNIRTSLDPPSVDFAEAMDDTECENLITHEECHTSCGCANRRLQLGWFAKTDILPAGQKGYGLFAAENILPGDFITEYIGEVVNKETLEERFREGVKKGLTHVYAMHMQGKMYIDSSVKGNEARFINHSCEPNAATQKMTVGNEIRIAIVAIKNIKKGEEITFDYMFESWTDKHVPCFCGSAKCKGYFC